MFKNDISCKFGIFATTKKWLNIFEKCFTQIEAINPIYCFLKLEMILIKVLQRSSKRKQVFQIAYITHMETMQCLPYPYVRMTHTTSLCPSGGSWHMLIMFKIRGLALLQWGIYDSVSTTLAVSNFSVMSLMSFSLSAATLEPLIIYYITGQSQATLLLIYYDRCLLLLHYNYYK